MKKNKLTLILGLLFGVILQSCEKENSSIQSDSYEKTKYNSNKSGESELDYQSQINMELNGVENQFNYSSDEEFISWERTGSENDFIKLVEFDLEEFGQMSVISKNNTEIEVYLGSDTIIIENILINEANNEFTFESSVSGQSDTITGSVSSNETNFTSMIDNLPIGNANPNFPASDPGDTELGPLAIVFGLAVLTAAVIDYLCDQQIANDVAACAANCQGAVVGTCGATCIDVCTP